MHYSWGNVAYCGHFQVPTPRTTLTIHLSILSTTSIDEVFCWKSTFQCNRFDPPARRKNGVLLVLVSEIFLEQSEKRFGKHLRWITWTQSKFLYQNCITLFTLLFHMVTSIILGMRMFWSRTENGHVVILEKWWVRSQSRIKVPMERVMEHET